MRELAQALLQQLRADHETAAALLCVKLLGLRFAARSCAKRGARVVSVHTGLSTDDLGGTLGSVLPSLETLSLGILHTCGPDNVQRRAEGISIRIPPLLEAACATEDPSVCSRIVVDLFTPIEASPVSVGTRGAVVRLEQNVLAFALEGVSHITCLRVQL